MGGGPEEDNPDVEDLDFSIKCSTASIATPASPRAAPLEIRLPSPLRRREPPINSPPKSFSGLNIISPFRIIDSKGL